VDARHFRKLIIGGAAGDPRAAAGGNSRALQSRSVGAIMVANGMKNAPVAAWYDDEGLWCVSFREGDRVWVERYQVVIYD
jgi:hypothetical protein